MKMAAAQISCALGDFDANLRKVRDFAMRAKKTGAQLVVFPEMVDTGYSMPVVQKDARNWKNGAVVELQNIAKENSIAIVAGISDRDAQSFAFGFRNNMFGIADVGFFCQKRVFFAAYFARQPVKRVL